jgi:peptide/nickel transport system permease protein
LTSAEASRVAKPAAPPERRRGPTVWRRLRKEITGNPLAIASVAVTAVVLAFSIFAPWLAAHDPIEQRIADRLQAPSPRHWLGTDHLGRDMYSRIVWGARTSVTIGLLGVLAGALIGITLGTISAYYAGRADAGISWVVDTLLAFPGILLAILIMTMLGTGTHNVVLAIGVYSVPTYTRLTRSVVLTAKAQEYFDAARAIGAGTPRIMVRYLLANSLSPLIVYSTLRMATAILTIASLSYLGLGVGPPLPEWGAMVALGQEYGMLTPHMVFVPGIAIFLAIMAFNFLGDAVRDALDPRMRGIR